MSKYLLSTYMVDGEVGGAPSTPEEIQAFMQRVMALEASMDESDAFVFGGALDSPDAATVVDTGGATNSGPFVTSTGHLAGFYIIDADGPDEALEWAAKVAVATNHPIEVRPFRATGRVADHVAE